MQMEGVQFSLGGEVSVLEVPCKTVLVIVKVLTFYSCQLYTIVVILGILDNVVQFLDVEIWSYPYSSAMYLCFFTGWW